MRVGQTCSTCAAFSRLDTTCRVRGPHPLPLQAGGGGMQVAGISCITNLATGITDAKLSHAEVTEVASNVKQKFAELLRGVIKAIV